MRTLILWFAFFAVILTSCANTSNPTGGEGDKEPPRVVASTPLSGATNIATDEKIEIKFSEWIEPKSAESGILVSPKVDSGISISVRGRTVTVSPNTSWQKDRTYHISTNSELLDYSRNALDSVTDLIFSTGASLDKGNLSGVINKSPILKERPKVGLYLEEHLSAIDTTLTTPFDYITQCDSLGHFHFENIAEVSYKVIAFIDEDADNRVTPKESVFLTKEEIVTANTDSLTLLEGSSDTAALTLEKVKPINQNLLLYTIKTFNHHRGEDILATIKSKEGDTLATNLVYSLSDDSTFLSLNLPIDIEQKQYELITTVPRPFVDTTELTYYVDTTLFNGLTQIDSTVPEISAIKKYQDKTTLGFTVTWSIPMELEHDTVVLTDTLNTEYAFVARGGQKKTVHYKALSELPLEQTLSMRKQKIIGKSISGISSVQDTADTSKITVRTLSKDALAHSLTIVLDSIPQHGLLHLKGLKTSTEYLIPMDKDTLTLSSPLAGKYSVAYHEDINSNQQKDMATLFPFTTGEKTTYLTDTIHIPPRWEVEHGLILKSKELIPEDSTTAIDTTQIIE